MSHGFSRFGPSTARERFHARAGRGTSFAIYLPTILATLALFGVTIALNKMTSMANDKTVPLINVDDVFPTKAAADRNMEKAFWEAPPPPSPESVIAPREESSAPQLVGEPASSFAPRELNPPSSTTPVKTRPIPSIDSEIRMPDVQPDTKLPEGVRP